MGLLIHSSNPDRFLTLMRAGILPFFLLACLVVFFWTRHTFGSPAAALATLLFTLVPPVLAHAGLATTDMGLAACLGAAFFALILWAESPTWKRSVLLGLAGASAVLSKFTALGYLPAAAVFALLAWGLVAKPGSAQLAQLARERAPGFLLAAAIGVVTIWAAYYFSFGPMPGGGASLPAPEFFDGIRTALRHNSEGHPSYLLGRNGTNGWWYYFPVALAVKTPIAFLILLALGVWVCVKRRAQVGVLLPLAFVLGILLPAMAGNVNIGVRHILPIYMGLSIIAAAGLHPHSPNYRGGRARPGALDGHLGRSQPSGLSGIFQRVRRQRAGKSPGGFRPRLGTKHQTTRPPPETTGRHRSQFRRAGTAAAHTSKSGRVCPRSSRSTPPIPAEGWTAVSPTIDKTTQYGLYFRYPTVQPWFDSLTPKERVGSYLLYYVPPGTLRR